MERDSFVFYRSFYKALNGLPPDVHKEIITAICEYALDGTEPELDGISYTVFELIRPQIDANNKRYVNGAKGGRPKKPLVLKTITNGYETGNHRLSNEKPNVNDNVNENDNENENENENVKEKRKRKAAEPQGETLVEEMGFSPELESTVKSWVRYKTEKRQAYKPTGLKSLLSRIKTEADARGDRAVIDLINLSMSNNWQGIIWDKVQKQDRIANRVKEVASWII